MPKKTQRQMPRDTNITSSALYQDLLYGYLQVNALVTEDKRKIWTLKILSFTNIAHDLGCSRQTVSKKFYQLVQLGLIKSCSEGYELIDLERSQGFLLPIDTLRKLVNTLKENAITIYIYLLNRFEANSQQPYGFSIDGLKQIAGLGSKSRNNNYIVTDILEILQRLGLIKYTVVNTTDEKQRIYTQYILLFATNNFPK